jgi:calmodulin
MASRVVQSNLEEVVKEVFAVFDEDNKGYVNQADLLRVMEKLEEDTEEINDLFGAADVNGDGTIDYDEFVELMTATI